MNFKSKFLSWCWKMWCWRDISTFIPWFILWRQNALCHAHYLRCLSDGCEGLRKMNVMI